MNRIVHIEGCCAGVNIDAYIPDHRLTGELPTAFAVGDLFRLKNELAATALMATYNRTSTVGNTIKITKTDSVFGKQPPIEAVEWPQGQLLPPELTNANDVLSDDIL